MDQDKFTTLPCEFVLANALSSYVLNIHVPKEAILLKLTALPSHTYQSLNLPPNSFSLNIRVATSHPFSLDQIVQFGFSERLFKLIGSAIHRL